MMSTATAIMMESCSPSPSGQPEEGGAERGEMDHRRIGAGPPVGEAHIGAARRHGRIEEALHLVHQRVVATRRHPQAQRALTIEAAGMDRIARRDGARKGLARHHGFVQAGAAGLHDAVRRHPLARRHSTMSPAASA